MGKDQREGDVTSQMKQPKMRQPQDVSGWIRCARNDGCTRQAICSPIADHSSDQAAPF
jgi:hypothetical protein